MNVLRKQKETPRWSDIAHVSVTVPFPGTFGHSDTSTDSVLGPFLFHLDLATSESLPHSPQAFLRLIHKTVPQHEETRLLLASRQSTS